MILSFGQTKHTNTARLFGGQNGPAVASKEVWSNLSINGECDDNAKVIDTKTISYLEDTRWCFTHR